MGIVEAFLIGLALAMDCLAVSTAAGSLVKRVIWRPMLTMVVLFGAFQGGMVLIGWLFTSLFSRFLEPIDHWIAFFLLLYVGIRMIREGTNKNNNDAPRFNPLEIKIILTLAVATSIDALAVGVSMALMQIRTWEEVGLPAGIIAALSSLLTAGGLSAGIFAGRKLPFSTAIPGGVILIAIGIKILAEHLGAI